MSYNEKWIYIKGNKTKYKIRSNGEIYNTRTNSIMKGGLDKNGYHIVSLTLNGKKYTKKVHRLVAKYFIPNPEKLPEVNHEDGNKCNNDESNLRWVTSAENTHHAICNNLRTSSLSISDVEKICQLLELNELSIQEIAYKVGVKYSSVVKIKNGVNWSSISKNYDISNYNQRGFLCGDKNPYSKIKYNDAVIICGMLEKGYTPTDISKRLKISRKIIYDIKNKHTWVTVSSKFDI